jgi:hypothetical protein
MNPALFFALWSLAAGTLLSGLSFVHLRYQKAIASEAEAFAISWKKLESRYDNKL